jgi:hypothetical protein
MKPKSILNLALTVALAPFLPGCMLSYSTVECANKTQMDTFNPSSVYQKENPRSLMLEGTRYNHDQTQVHAYVIIPEQVLLYYTNGDFTLQNVKDLQEHIGTTYLKHSRHLRSGYVKVADFPKNDVQIEMVAHHPNAYLLIFLPMTFIIDVVAFPVEAVIAVRNGHT